MQTTKRTTKRTAMRMSDGGVDVVVDDQQPVREWFASHVADRAGAAATQLAGAGAGAGIVVGVDLASRPQQTKSEQKG